MAQDGNDNSSEITRRDFVGNAAKGATALAVAAPLVAGAASSGLPSRPLGKTGADVSVLCLGGWHIGYAASQDEAAAIKVMHAAVDEGVTFFDNSWDYHDGGSELVMGKALASGRRRDKVFLMTKGCERDYQGAKRCIDESLKRLQTDYLDLWQFHEIIYENDPDWVFERDGIRAAVEAKEAWQDPPHRLHRPSRSARSQAHAGQAVRLGNRADAHQHDGCAFPQLPRAHRAALRGARRRRHRHEEFRRRRHSRPRPASAQTPASATLSASRFRPWWWASPAWTNCCRTSPRRELSARWRKPNKAHCWLA